MEVWGLCPKWGPGAKPLVRGWGQSSPEADDVLLIQQQHFCVYSYFYAEMHKKAVVCQNRHIFGGLQRAALQLSVGRMQPHIVHLF